MVSVMLVGVVLKLHHLEQRYGGLSPLPNKFLVEVTRSPWDRTVVENIAKILDPLNLTEQTVRTASPHDLPFDEVVPAGATHWYD